MSQLGPQMDPERRSSKVRFRPIDRHGPASRLRRASSAWVEVVTADLAPDESDGEVGTVQSLGDAMAALAAYYERNRPKWHRESASRYTECTQFGFLRVEQDRSGSWVAYRDHYPLLRMGAPAIFRTRGEAQGAAEAHVLDYYPDGEIIEDGLSWLGDPEIDWRSYPHRVEDRAEWQRMASQSLP